MTLFTPGSWSIALRLAFLFTIAAAALLVATLTASYWIVLKHTNRDNDQFLSDKLVTLRGDLAEDSGPRSLRQELENSRGGDNAYWIRLYDPSGRIVAETAQMRDFLPPGIFPSRPFFVGNRHPDHTYRDNAGHTFALVTTYAGVGGTNYILQLAQDRTSDERFAAHLRILFTALLGCAVLTCAGLSLLVTYRGLRPLSRIAESVERVGARHLDERVPADGWPKEVRPLAIAFNHMLARLEGSFTRLSQFSADLAHELRTPIAILRGEAEEALTKGRTAEDYRRVIESGLEEFHRLSRLIDNLLFLARAEATISLRKSLFEGRPAVEKIREFYEPVSEEQEVGFRYDGEAEIYAEPVLFRRALVNLVSNALRFTPSGGTVSVTLARGNNETEISVGDTGCGIAPKHLEKVFDRFFRGDAPRSSEGTGLGLAIVKSIMQMHGGSVSITSQLNRGTMVRLVFPNPPVAPAGSSSGARMEPKNH